MSEAAHNKLRLSLIEVTDLNIAAESKVTVDPVGPSVDLGRGKRNKNKAKIKNESK